MGKSIPDHVHVCVSIETLERGKKYISLPALCTTDKYPAHMYDVL
jgi:hypothetical protein